MLDYIIENKIYIVLIIAVVSSGLYEWNKTKAILYGLMLQAKRLAIELVLNTGKEQEEWVLERAYEYLPKWISFMIPREMMRSLIAYLYGTAKDYLKDIELEFNK